MTVDEAVRSLEEFGPGSGEWKPWRAVRANAIELLESVSSQTIDRFVPRLRAICERLEQRDLVAQRAAALPLVRWCVARADPEPLRALARAMPYSRPVFDAIARAADLGVDVWPLVEPLLSSPELDRASLESLLAHLLRPEGDGAPQRFARVAAVSPALAARVAGELGFWKQAPLAPFAGTLTDLYLAQSGEAKEAAGRALKIAATQPLPLVEVVERLQAALATQTGDEAEQLAWVLTLERLKQGQDPEALAGDRRSRVRLGALQALGRGLAEHPERWRRCLRGVLDDSDAVRAAALELVRAGIEDGLPFDEGFGRELIANLGRPSGAQLAQLLSFVATRHPGLKPGWLEAMRASDPSGPLSALRKTFEAPLTRACPRCRSLPRYLSWNHDSAAPKRASALEQVPGDGSDEALRRCPECQAHFLYRCESEHDVNSRHDFHSLLRLKLTQLRQHHAGRFDPSHPRVQSWEEALRADLHHVEPAVRAEAEWELSVKR